jgi:hypothetical protein
MKPNLSRYLNKTILVSIPAVFEDGKCRPYKLAGIELVGLWLEGAELANRFLAHEYKTPTPMTWAVFIPFSQIACVAITTGAVATPGQPASANQNPVPEAPPPADTEVSSSTTNAATRKKSKVKET